MPTGFFKTPSRVFRFRLNTTAFPIPIPRWQLQKNGYEPCQFRQTAPRRRI